MEFDVKSDELLTAIKVPKIGKHSAYVKFGRTKRVPGLCRYRMSVVMKDSPENPFDAVSELWFDNEEDYKKAFSSEEGRRAAEDAIAHCSTRIHLITEEKEIL